MPFNNRDLKRDARGNIVPQYFDIIQDDYQVVSGNEGAINISNQTIKLREDFSGSALNADWSVVALGSGHTINVTNSQLDISTGTTANTETIIRSTKTFKIPLQIAFIARLSQRIANQEFYLEFIDSTGQHYVRWMFDGTNDQSAKITSSNANVLNGPNTVSIYPSNTFRSFYIRNLVDETLFINRDLDQVAQQRLQYHVNRLLPDPNRDYYIQIRAKNLTTAPGSSTTFSIDAIIVHDWYNLTAEISSGQISLDRSQHGINLLQFFTETETALGANATFTGPARDLAGQYGYFRALVFANVAGTLNFEQSMDGSVWTTVKTTSVTASQGIVDQVQVAARYVRVRYVNGGTAQSTFRLYTSAVAF